MHRTSRHGRFAFHPGSHPRPRAARRGLSIAELMISLAITATLLTGVAVAFSASFAAYKVNQERASIQHQGRIIMNRLLATVRTTQLHAPQSTTLRAQFAAGQTVTDTGISMYTPSNVLVTYAYDAANKRLQVTDNGKTYTLLDGVDTFSVTMQPMQSPASQRTGGGYDWLQRATVLLTVRTTPQTARSMETTGSQTYTFSSSVMPRRNVW